MTQLQGSENDARGTQREAGQLDPAQQEPPGDRHEERRSGVAQQVVNQVSSPPNLSAPFDVSALSGPS